MEIKQNIGRNCPKNYIYSSRHSMTIEKKMKGDIESENNGRDHDKKKSRSQDEDYFRQVDTMQCVSDVLKLNGIYASKKIS